MRLMAGWGLRRSSWGGFHERMMQSIDDEGTFLHLHEHLCTATKSTHLFLARQVENCIGAHGVSYASGNRVKQASEFVAYDGEQTNMYSNRYGLYVVARPPVPTHALYEVSGLCHASSRVRTMIGCVMTKVSTVHTLLILLDFRN